MKNLLLLFVSFTCFALHSSEVVVKGKIVGFSDSQIAAYLTKDYITFSQEKIAISKIEDGNFHLSFSITETQKLTLTVEDKSASIYVEPGQVYNINLSYNEELNAGKIYDKTLSIRLPYPTTTGMNELIASFNNDYDRFFQRYYTKIFLGAAAKEVQAFADSILEVEKYRKVDFAKNYALYSTANLLDISGVPDKKLKEDFLNGKAILYKNPEYMSFFKQLFNERFRQFAISTQGVEMRKAIMLEEDLKKTLSLIQKGENLSSTGLAELYLLNGLFEDYHIKTIDQKSNKKMLEIMAKDGQTAESRLVAQNILSKLSLTRVDSKAPEFTLKNSKGESVSLSDFKGKYVYINFWSSWSVPSLKELNVMKVLYPKYKDKVEFISINMDDDGNKMDKILKENNYPWPFLHYSYDFNLKEKYQVKTVPSYYFINKSGEFVVPTARSPLQIEETFWNLK